MSGSVPQARNGCRADQPVSIAPIVRIAWLAACHADVASAPLRTRALVSARSIGPSVVWAMLSVCAAWSNGARQTSTRASACSEARPASFGSDAVTSRSLRLRVTAPQSSR